MSGVSDSTICPNCGSENASSYYDWKPFPYYSIQCYECGLMIGPELKYMSLVELNMERKSYDMEPIDKLPEQNPDI